MLVITQWQELPLGLCISAFTSQLSLEDLQNALEKTTVNDIKEWTVENIGTTVLSKRRKLFSIKEKVG